MGFTPHSGQPSKRSIARSPCGSASPRWRATSHGRAGSAPRTVGRRRRRSRARWPKPSQGGSPNHRGLGATPGAASQQPPMPAAIRCAPPVGPCS
ncbi:hypothetical protein SGCZBJ_03740 [Caulobacter zeae]|uniref:Uncharacterized protein n=1 Tax=Caulobacter zeae TaxID=2055137 RepID=A0A2N5DPY8_9CAUL|nr:hypothetical protein SGCZBJ_03740 [Caulobacter zeae]